MKRLRKLTLALFLVLLAGELFARVRLYRHFKDTGYLTAPFGMKRPMAPATPPSAVPANNPVAAAQAATQAALAERQYFDGYYKMLPGEHQGTRGTYRINALGFRGPDFHATTKGARTRVFSVGDSNTIGLDLPEGQTWPALLQRSLNQQSGTAEVVNAGMGGYTTLHALNLIRSELLNYSPDVLIVFLGVNDLNEDRGPATGARLVTAIHNQLYYHLSMLYTLAVEKVSVMRTASPVPVTVYADRQVDGLATNASSIIDASRSKGVKVVFVRAVVNAPGAVFLADDAVIEAVRAADPRGPTPPAI